jgi:hypothetical protein
MGFQYMGWVGVGGRKSGRGLRVSTPSIGGGRGGTGWGSVVLCEVFFGVTPSMTPSMWITRLAGVLLTPSDPVHTPSIACGRGRTY